MSTKTLCSITFETSNGYVGSHFAELTIKNWKASKAEIKAELRTIGFTDVAKVKIAVDLDVE